jgi:quercetin dioxygenase-like cupin family protein
MKINANFRVFAGVNFDASKYIESPAYGVNRFMLDRIGTEKARATTIVEYTPNSKFPEHTHIGGEEFLVLEGTFKDKFGEFPAGTYVRNPIGSDHAPWVDEDGCTIMVKLLQMADTGEGTASLHINTTKGKDSKGVVTDYGTVVLDLYYNNQTGERVQMFWVKPDGVLSIDDHAKGGEEFFVVEGSLSLGEDEYKRWGWLRFPEGGEDATRPSLKAGISGAQVYRKTGHLTQKALGMEKIQITED